MINASELRPGNRVQYAHQMRIEDYCGGEPSPYMTLYGTVDSVRIGQSRILPDIPPHEEISLDGFVGVIHPNMLAGIPLTPELLEKCGFETTTTEHTYGNGRIGIFFYEGEYTYGIAKGKYLHQLQNLFYCLTGQELNIKL